MNLPFRTLWEYTQAIVICLVLTVPAVADEKECGIEFLSISKYRLRSSGIEIERVEGCYPSGKCIISVDSPKSVVPFKRTRNQLKERAEKAGGRLAETDFNEQDSHFLRTSHKINCHSYAFYLNNVPLPPKAWINTEGKITDDTDPVSIILADYFTPVKTLLENEYADFHKDSDLQEGDLVLFYQLDWRTLREVHGHTGIVIKEPVGKGHENWVRSKDGHYLALDMPFDSIEGQGFYPADRIEIYRRKPSE